jgi:hypothetical protein
MKMIVVNATTLKANVIAVRGMGEIPSSLREDLVVFGLARVIAYGTAIPPEPVANPVAFFDENSGEVKAAVSQVNENTVLNLRKVVELAGVIYRARYDMVHNSLSQPAQALCQQALIAGGQYNFPQAIADALAQSEQSDDLGRSIGFALNLFAVISLPGAGDATADEE